MAPVDECAEARLVVHLAIRLDERRSKAIADIQIRRVPLAAQGLRLPIDERDIAHEGIKAAIHVYVSVCEALCLVWSSSIGRRRVADHEAFDPPSPADVHDLANVLAPF